MKISNGEVWIASNHFPDKKLPHICYGYEKDNVCHDCGHFNNEESANNFMEALCRMLGIADEVSE